MFYQESYGRHSKWYNQHFPTRESKINHYLTAKSAGNYHIAHWIQQIFFNCLDPLLIEQGQNWLTVGDAYGFDAQYILNKNCLAVATDLNTDFLAVAKEEGIISAYAAENAEQLSFRDNTFDYVLCKESYHHFPRPYAAMYEMIRVAKNGIIVIEPQDPVSKIPILLLLQNLLAACPRLLHKVWPNRFSFEPVGNFVYKVSEREFEKLAAGLHLPMVAFKHINPNFYFKGADSIMADSANRQFLSIKRKKQLLDLLVRLKVIPGQVLATIVFKQAPDEGTIKALRADGYKLINIPANPYLGNTTPAQ